jgi:hypothetical protein
MISKSKKTVALHLDPVLYQQLDDLACDARFKSLAKYIENHLRKFIGEQSKPPLPPEIPDEESKTAKLGVHT